MLIFKVVFEMETNDKMIEFNNVTAIYKNGSGIFDIELKINKSEMIYLMGPTGSGKSTVLKSIYKENDIFDIPELSIQMDELNI